MLLTIGALSLGVFALLNTIKLLLPAQLQPGGKLLAALALSGLLAPWFVADVREGVLLTLAVFGLSTVLHGAHKLLEATGDERRIETLAKPVPSRR